MLVGILYSYFAVMGSRNLKIKGLANVLYLTKNQRNTVPYNTTHRHIFISQVVNAARIGEHLTKLKDAIKGATS